jgi:hypothetical protein
MGSKDVAHWILLQKVTRNDRNFCLEKLAEAQSE